MNDELKEWFQARHGVVSAQEQEKIMKEQERFEDADLHNTYPQDQEENEYRFLDPAWLDEIARGLTKGAVKHPGETWRTIPCDEHLARALRHINLYRMGDRDEPHLINASMRLMMAFCTGEVEDTREAWEKLMKDMERGRLNA